MRETAARDVGNYREGSDSLFNFYRGLTNVSNVLLSPFARHKESNHSKLFGNERFKHTVLATGFLTQRFTCALAGY